MLILWQAQDMYKTEVWKGGTFIENWLVERQIFLPLFFYKLNVAILQEVLDYTKSNYFKIKKYFRIINGYD